MRGGAALYCPYHALNPLPLLPPPHHHRPRGRLSPVHATAAGAALSRIRVMTEQNPCHNLRRAALSRIASPRRHLHVVAPTLALQPPPPPSPPPPPLAPPPAAAAAAAAAGDPRLEPVSVTTVPPAAAAQAGDGGQLTSAES